MTMIEGSDKDNNYTRNVNIMQVVRISNHWFVQIVLHTTLSCIGKYLIISLTLGSVGFQ